MGDASICAFATGFNSNRWNSTMSKEKPWVFYNYRRLLHPPHASYLCLDSFSKNTKIFLKSMSLLLPTTATKSSIESSQTTHPSHHQSTTCFGSVLSWHTVVHFYLSWVEPAGSWLPTIMFNFMRMNPHAQYSQPLPQLCHPCYFFEPSQSHQDRLKIA